MKKMIFALLAAGLWSCGSKIAYTVTVSGLEGVSEVSLVDFDSDEMLVPAVGVDEDATAVLKGSADKPTIGKLIDGDGDYMGVVFLDESGSITVDFSDEEIYTIGGTTANDAYNVVEERMNTIIRPYVAMLEGDGVTDEYREDFEAEFNAGVVRGIEENIDNLCGVYMLVKYGSMRLEPSEIILEYIARMPKSLQEMPIIEPVKTDAENSLKVAVGQPYTDISGVDPEGNTLSLSSLVGEGRWVLVDFWATWCGPCRAEITELKKAYDKYSGSGFEVLGVSLDRNREAWRTFLVEEEIKWVSINDMNDEGKMPSAVAYGVKFIPTNILISPSGEIVLNTNDWSEVDAKLTEIFE